MVLSEGCDDTNKSLLDNEEGPTTAKKKIIPC
jgi:hypothetical protein